MTDNRTNEPTEAQVERAKRAFYAHFWMPSDAGYEDARDEHEKLDEAMRAALVAAQGAAPQAECDCGAGPGSAVCKKVCATRAPVLPSSGVDEDKLANIVEAEIVKLRFETRLYPDVYKAQVARAVAEWLKGQQR